MDRVGIDSSYMNNAVRGVVYLDRIDSRDTVEDIFSSSIIFPGRKMGSSFHDEERIMGVWDLSDVMPEGYDFEYSRMEIRHTGLWDYEEGELRLRCDLMYSRKVGGFLSLNGREPYGGWIAGGVEPDEAAIGEYLDGFGMEVNCNRWSYMPEV